MRGVITDALVGEERGHSCPQTSTFQTTDVFHLANVDHTGAHAPSRVVLRALAEGQGTFPADDVLSISAEDVLRMKINLLGVIERLLGKADETSFD